MKRIIIIPYLLLSGLYPLLAQVQVSVSLDTATVMIGDHIKLTVDIAAPPGTRIEQIDYSRWEKEGPLELLDLSPLNTIAEQPRLLQQQEARYITFDTGYHRLPPLAVVYRTGVDGSLDTVYSTDLGLQVFTLAVQGESEIRDNKDIIEEPFHWTDAWPLYIVVVLILLGLLFWQAWRRRKMRQEELKAPPPPPLPPHVIALNKLDALAADKAWERGQIKAFQSDLTHLLREYLDARYGLKTLEATTAESLQQLRQTRHWRFRPLATVTVITHRRRIDISR
ncbi:MAG: hypothetical protein D6772_02555, partial [Bacteroidetes bacterium]